MLLLCTNTLYAQEVPETSQDSTQTGAALGRIELKDPESISSKYTYDPVTDNYIYTQTVGGYDIKYPVILSPEQYQELILKEQMNNYFQDKIDAISGRGANEESQKNLLPNFYVNSDFFETIFGGNTIEVIPQGSVAMDLGVRFQKNDNPALSPRNRSNISFDFDQRISLSLMGKVGERLSINANYDTEATFDFQNLIKLEYTPDEDNIIQSIEVGNVSMPINSSLISGAQSLFGIKTALQFGRTTITGVYSEQRSQSRNVVAQGGGTINDFEIMALDYDEDRHFFLSHFFRDQYDTALENYPYIRSQVQITRIEVWVTNRTQRTQNVRNLVGLQDLGEPDPVNTRISDQAPAGFFNSGNSLPSNQANDFNPFGIESGNSVLTAAVRDIATVQQGFNIPNYSPNQGYDYSILENARKLEPNREYTLDPKLGYISLNQRLSNDEVLAVAYQYTYQGAVYQVGEFANDGINATEFEESNGIVTQVNPQALVVKMLKSNITEVRDPIWDLMMKNFYSTSAFQLSQEEFKLNILYTDPSPINYISPVDEATWPAGLEEKILLNVFNFDRLNTYNDPQNGGDGYFDFLPGITVDTQNGIIKFTKVEPFGKYLYEVLGGGGNYDDQTGYIPNNDNQKKYVYRNMYKVTKSASLENAEKNKFMLKGRYKSESSGGIPLGAFNVPRGSVRVTAGGRMLQEGIDYTVNYQAGTVQILDPGLRASNTPIEVSVENNAVFGQQTRRFSGIHVEHQFNEKFSLGGTFLNMNERPLTQKSNFGVEPVNNTIFGLNGTYSTEIPFLTRMVNKLPNIDTDVASNLSLRGEFAYLLPGAPKSANFDGEITSYLDDFEGAQSFIDIRSALAWSLASVPRVPEKFGGQLNNDDIGSRHNRAKLSWYTIDPIFYSSQRPGGVSSDDISSNETRRIFIDEIFPQQDIAQGQTLVQPTLDIAYYPQEKGPYNDNQSFEDLPTDERWGGIMRSINSTNFEQSNVEYIQFWMLDPYYKDGVLQGDEGELVFNLGKVSEDILKDGRKQYENGLPLEQNPALVNTTNFGKVPSTQSLVYAFNANAGDRTRQDVGYDGLTNKEEANFYSNPGPDPALDDYQFYLDATGSIPNRYKNYNNPEGNSPVEVGDNNRGSTTLPDVEDIDRDLTMNTVENYLSYSIDIKPGLSRNDKFVTDIREVEIEAPNRDTYRVRWIQFKVPIAQYDDTGEDIDEQAILRSMSFMRMYLSGFDQEVVLRFATLDLVRGDWRLYSNSLQPDVDNDPGDDNTVVDVKTVNIQENEQRTPIPYKLPPGVVREQLNNNNTIIRQNEQSLSFAVEGLEPMDSRGVFKNVDIDVRQYKRLKMFIHAERYKDIPVADGDLVAFLRLGTDFTQNYYQVEIPLQITPGQTTDPATIWPNINSIDLPLSLLSKIKAQGIADGTLHQASFYDENGNPIDEFEKLEVGQMKVAIKGNPSLGNIRALMVGLKNPNTGAGADVSGEVWFNELRLAELDNQGGWAAVAAMDLNIADFANISTTANMSTSGFGSIDQMPGERSLENIRGYALNSNVNLGQLLPKGWGVQLPMNYSVSEELITPEFDPLYQDLRLEDRIDAAETSAQKDAIQNQAEDYTKRRSINFIGVRKNRGEEQKPRVYDIENFTFNLAYNQMEHRDYEIENLEDQHVRAGIVYSHSFKPLDIAPLKNADSLLNDKYWSWLKDFNFNLLPTSISLNSNINRNLNRQSFRQVIEEGIDSDFLGLPEVQQRNYMFDWQYAINYNLTKSLQFNFTASNNSIVKNYFSQGEDGEQLVNRDLAIWDGFWDVGDPNRHAQQLQVNYDLPFDKFPFLDFMSATYAYTGSFDWQRGSDVLTEIAGEQLNTIQNANTHNFNGALTMDKLYASLGLKRKSGGASNSRGALPIANPNAAASTTESKQKKYGMYNTFIDLATMVKRINVSYSENRGKVLPGYTPSIGFIGTLKPSWGFVFGSQSDIRYEAAQKGWLTSFPEFNDQYMSRKANQLNIAANIQPIQDLTIDLVADRQYSESYAENYTIEDLNADGILDYNALIQNKYGDFSISSLMLRTAFDQSEETQSETFSKFSENRIVIAQRLAGVPINPNATEYPQGYGPTNQSVLLPAFVSAYTGQSAASVSTAIFRNTPVPNWTLKYTGLMRIGWFKDNFRRFSLAHGYRSSYTINSFRSNLDYGQGGQFDQAGNFKNPILITNATLVEQFNPLIRVDFEMANSLSILAEMRKDRALSLSFDNNLLTEMSGNEYVVGLGYRIPNIKFVTHIGGRRSVMSGDLNLKADVSLRDNITVIRNLDINTNQITAGQNIWSLKFTADYALSKNLTALFFYDHAFSEFKVSTAFPQTTIRTGFTLRYNFGN
jgi:cell surface protein SprA